MITEQECAMRCRMVREQALAESGAVVSELLAVLARAQEELRLIRMKDCAAVYDTTLRLDMKLLLDRSQADARPAQDQSQGETP